MKAWVRYFFTFDYWHTTWLWIRYGGCLHRCECCGTWNRSVTDWSNKFSSTAWYCGECGYGACDFDCNGVRFRKREKETNA